MKISVITVCYNSIKTLENTIQSVKNQTYKDIEYIIVDGGSTDGTLDIITKYSDIVDKWISGNDNGLYDAMNKGIELSTAEYIGILNSDDTFYCNNTIENIADFLSFNMVDACIGNIEQHNEYGRVIRKYNSKKWTPDRLKIGFMPPHPSIFFRRDLFKKFGYYSLEFKIGADYELITRYFLKNQISWKYSGITTTSMLLGGLSTSGLESYNLITNEINKSLAMNQIKYNSLLIRLRFLWKLLDYI